MCSTSLALDVVPEVKYSRSVSSARVGASGMKSAAGRGDAVVCTAGPGRGCGGSGVAVRPDPDERVVTRDVGELGDVGISDGGPGRAAALHPVLEVGGTHQGGGGDHDDAQLDAGQHEFPEFHLVAEHDDHPVPAPHALPPQPVGHLGGTPGEVREAAPRCGPVLLHDHQRRLVRRRRVCRELVEPVQGEVEFLETGPLEFAPGGVVVTAQGQQTVPRGAEFLSHGHGAPFEVLWRSRSGRSVAQRRCLGSIRPGAMPA